MRRQHRSSRREQVWKLPHLPSRNSNGWKSFLHKKVFAALLTPAVYVHTYYYTTYVGMKRTFLRMLLCTDPLLVAGWTARLGGSECGGGGAAR